LIRKEEMGREIAWVLREFFTGELLPVPDYSSERINNRIAF
jgi:hypothetical protein